MTTAQPNEETTYYTITLATMDDNKFGIKNLIIEKNNEVKESLNVNDANIKYDININDDKIDDATYKNYMDEYVNEAKNNTPTSMTEKLRTGFSNVTQKARYYTGDKAQKFGKFASEGTQKIRDLTKRGLSGLKQGISSVSNVIGPAVKSSAHTAYNSFLSSNATGRGGSSKYSKKKSHSNKKKTFRNSKK